MAFLPINRKEMLGMGIEKPDFVFVTGDAYIDHPSFGTAIISRVLEDLGYSVCILPQPNWNNLEEFSQFGEPNLGFLVTSGNIDSMVNHYTVAKKKRSNDLYSPGGKSGMRPDRAAIVYCQKIRAVYKHTPIILGGIEASLRRLAHYDYWDDKVRRSILIDSGADIVVYGMGEKIIEEIAKQLKDGIDIKNITNVLGTAYKSKDISDIKNSIMLPGFAEIQASKNIFAQSFKTQYNNLEAGAGNSLIESYDGLYVIQNPPMPILSKEALDRVYDLKYMRTYHNSYEEHIPAIEEVKYSIISNRGCFGGCNFCALSFHQGRSVMSRSHESILKEARAFTLEKDFKGYIHDVGGPTANFTKPACKKQAKSGACPNKKCLFPKPCEKLEINHNDYMELLKKLREIKGIKKVFIRSGIRYDYLIYDKNTSFFYELIKHHVSGQLKVAPEHVSINVLEKMGKPKREVYDKFVQKFKEINKTLGLKQFIVPYLMSSHPGSTIHDAITLAEYLRDTGVTPEQVQDFYPTPATLSTCMYYTGIDPVTMKNVHVPVSLKDKAYQRALIQYKLPQNYKLVFEALTLAGRKDLIGYGSKCLIKPKKEGANYDRVYKHKRR